MSGEELELYAGWTDEEVAAEMERLRTIDRFVETHCKASASTLQDRFTAYLNARRESLWDTGVAAYSLAAASRDAMGTGAATGERGAMGTGAAAKDEEPEDVRLVFCGEDWRLELPVPGAAAAESDLDLTLTGERGKPVESALLAIAGVTVPVEDGHAALPLSLFLAGMRETKVEVTWPSGRRSPGGLVFM